MSIQSGTEKTPLIQKNVFKDVENVVKPEIYHEPSLVSKIFFSWIEPLVWIGNERPIQIEDVPKLSLDNQSVKIVAKLEKNMQKIKPKNLCQLLWVIFITWPWIILFQAF